MSACHKKEEVKLSSFNYEALYKTEYSSAFDETDRETFRARHGYTCKQEQGYNGWQYAYRRQGAIKDMLLKADKWQGGGAQLDGEIMRAGKDAEAVRIFTLPKSGEAVIYGRLRCATQSSAAATLTVECNGATLCTQKIKAGDTVGKYIELTHTLTAGDRLIFAVSGAGAQVSFEPVITFENAQNTSLYHLTEMGKQYGDVFPYYDNEAGKLYMGFLWSDDARQGEYHNALEISDNMLTYTDVPEANNYAVWQKYKQEYRLHYLYDCNRYVDRSVYPAGLRDGFLYRDSESGRMLLIGGAYYRFDSSAQQSDLIIMASDDEFGLSWTKPVRVVEAGYNRNLPECPSLMKIGDRWYVFVSVAYVTAHQVGPLQYWTGDRGVDCLDVNWTDKDFAFLDGEDLCAARPTQIGDKVYMWGWIPALYDSMPWAPWAGYLNLPREVVQRADGSLGGRLDPALQKLLNYGNIYSLESGNYEKLSGEVSFANGKLIATGQNNYVSLATVNRTYTTFRMKMNGQGEAGYVLRSGGKEYRIVVVREGGNSYMKVLSPDDTKHTQNSCIEIANDLTDFNVQIVCDGEFVEFFVNGEYALTAHTAMKNSRYEAFMYSSGAAEFSDVSINKLIPYCEV